MYGLGRTLLVPPNGYLIGNEIAAKGNTWVHPADIQISGFKMALWSCPQRIRYFKYISLNYLAIRFVSEICLPFLNLQSQLVYL